MDLSVVGKQEVIANMEMSWQCQTPPFLEGSHSFYLQLLPSLILFRTLKGLNVFIFINKNLPLPFIAKLKTRKIS